MIKIDLNGAWQGHGISADGSQTKDFNATVPGCVQTDLYGDGLHTNVFWRDNADKVQWIENWSWRYTKTFTLEEIPTDCQLVCEGLDTYCDVYLNDRCIGCANNMFIPHSFDASKRLKVGENKLEIYFYSPIAHEAGHKWRDHSFSDGRFYTRRTQCSYGWDWVQRYVTFGIFRPIYLLSNTDLTVDNLYIYTTSIDEYSAQLSLTVNFDHAEQTGFATVNIIDPNGKTVWKNRRYVEETSFREWIDLADPQLWYPAGYGAQPLYTVKIDVTDRNGTPLGSHEETFGIRTLKVVQLVDEPNSAYADKCRELQQRPGSETMEKNTEYRGFIVLVNGIKVLCTGGNWVPPSPFPDLNTDAQITELLELAVEGNVNMIRVWGGGKFETPHFYHECDRLGILVTQDFLMACAEYPEDEAWFLEALRKEARHAAILIRNHPCLAWWSGDNENAVLGSDDCEWFTGRDSALKSIGPVLAEMDYNRPFFPSSPYGGHQYASYTVGTTHNTYYLDRIFPYMMNYDIDHFAFFREFSARFIAEEPACGAVSRPSILRFMTEDDFNDESDTMWLHHIKFDPKIKPIFFEYMVAFAKNLFGEFIDRDDRFFKMKYEHYEWIRVTMENCRRNQGFCNGLVYWMLNDAWPAAGGWSIIDYYNIPKPAFYAFKRATSGVIASVDRTPNGQLDVYVCNRTLQDQAVTANICIYNPKTGTKRGETVVTATATANKSVVIHTEPDTLSEDEMVLVDILGEQTSDRAFYKKNLPIGKTDTVRIVAQTDNTITVRADAYVHAVELEAAGVFSDNYFSLMPGEEKQVTFRPADWFDGHIALTGYTVI